VYQLDEISDKAHDVDTFVCASSNPTMSEKIKEFAEMPQQFLRDGNQFITRCTKPSQKEFMQICRAVAIGFAVMGFIGYFVKLIHIPINNILVGGA